MLVPETAVGGLLKATDVALNSSGEASIVCGEAQDSCGIFAEPIARLEDLKLVVRQLSEEVCRALVKRGQGGRRLDIVFRRID